MSEKEEGCSQDKKIRKKKGTLPLKEIIVEVPKITRVFPTLAKNKKKEVIEIVDSDEESKPRVLKTVHSATKPNSIASQLQSHPIFKSFSLSPPLCQLCFDDTKRVPFKACSDCHRKFHLNCLHQNQKCLQCHTIRPKQQELYSKKELKKQHCYKIFTQFGKRYPFYIKDEIILFPIQDKLLSIYPQLFEFEPLNRPLPHPHPSIPTHFLPALLKIQNFFRTFQDCLQAYSEVPSITKLLLLTTLDCIGTDYIFSKLLFCILQLYLSDILFKNKTQNVRILNDHSFFTLMSILQENDEITLQCTMKILPQLFKHLSVVPSCKFSINLPEILNLQTKITLLDQLIDGLTEVDEFRDLVAMKSVQIQALTKEKTQLLPKLKAAQAEMLTNKQTTQSNQIRSMRSAITTINRTIPFVTTKIINLGSDRNRSEYYFSILDPNMIYTRHRHYILDDSQQFLIYSTKQTIIELSKSFSQKGQRERQLIESLHSLLKDGLFQEQFQPPAVQPTIQRVNEQYSVSCDTIHMMALETEEMYSNYLAMRECEWHSNREQFMMQLCELREVKTLAMRIKAMQEGFLFVQEEGRRKKPMRIWGINSDTVKKCWLQYIDEADSFVVVWLCLYILLKHIERYVAKKVNSMKEQEIKDKRKKIQNVVERESSSEERRPNLRLRKRMQIMSQSSDSNNEEECEVCGECGSLLCCDTCPKVYHLHCLNIKSTPEGKWSCFKCLEKITNERQTRSKFKKNSQ